MTDAAVAPTRLHMNRNCRRQSDMARVRVLTHFPRRLGVSGASCGLETNGSRLCAEALLSVGDDGAHCARILVADADQSRLLVSNSAHDTALSHTSLEAILATNKKMVLAVVGGRTRGYSSPNTGQLWSDSVERVLRQTQQTLALKVGRNLLMHAQMHWAAKYIIVDLSMLTILSL